MPGTPAWDRTWAWDKPWRRPKAEVGDVLLTDDCHEFVIREITPEGVISREIFNPRHLWTWADLQKADCVISGHVDLETEAGPGLRTRERRGLVAAPKILAPEEWERLILAPRTDAATDMDRGVAAELLRLRPGFTSELVLRAKVNEGADNGFSVTLEESGGAPQSIDSAEILLAISSCYRAAAARQPMPWEEMTFRLMDGGDGMRYSVVFDEVQA